MADKLKITVVGDGTVGKTCMLVVYTTGIFPEEYIPTLFHNTIQNITVGDKTYEATLWNTAGQEEYERLRALSYTKTSCLLVCYSVDKSLPSYNNIRSKWAAELRHYLPNCPLILVGTKIDLRNDPTKNCYTEEDGNNLKKTIKAAKYMECSAKDSLGLNEIFQEAVRKSLSVEGLGKKRECSIL